MDPQIKEQVKMLKDCVSLINDTLVTLHRQNVLVHLSIERNNAVDPTSIKILLINQHIDYLKDVDE